MYRHASVNRIYRLVWSHSSSSWVPAAETTRGRGKGSCKALLATALSLCAGLTEAGPLGGQVVSGSGHIGQSAALTTITQTSPVLSLAWASFNVAPQETVNFVQPSAGAIAVNRITGTNGTQILGHLNANGQVYLINPNGIVFGRGSQVDVGGLVASTLDVNDASLGRDARTFSGTGSGSVLNQGAINATGDGAGGGYVALLGNRVSNQGTISARLGTVALGASSAATLTFQGDSLVHLQVDRSVLNSLAANGGLIRADGGQVLLSAGAKDALLAGVVNNTGIIEARTVENHGGTITLLGGMVAGTVNVAGTLDASAPDGGNGGFIETSAAHVEVANSAKVTTAAAHGLTGSWLVDPQDFVVAASGGDMTGAALSTDLATTSTVLQSSAGAATGSGNVNINDAVNWSANTTLTLTASNNVNINASLTATGNTAGLVIRANTINGSETASGPGIYTLNNGASINLPGTNPSLSIAGASYIVINSLGSAGSATGTDLQGANGNLAAHYALGSNIDASATADWNGGAGFMPIGTSATPFTGTFDGLGHTISNLSINRYMYYVGLFGEVGGTGIVRNTGMLGGSVHGGGYYDGILAGRNFGSISDSYTTGSLTGTSNSIGGLVGGNNGTVSNSYSTATIGGANNTGGLVGINYGSISNSYATGAVAGGYDVGGLLGFNRSGTATNVYSTGAVNGIANIGGLAGQNNGTVSNSYAAGNAHGTGATVAGLVGNNYGTVSDSYALGRVTGSSNLNGVANGGTVNNSFWNITTSGLATSARGTGLTTSQMQTAANFTGFGFATTPGSAGNAWVMVDIDGGLNNAGGYVGGQHYNSVPGATFPMLTSEYSTVIVNAHQLQLMALVPGASYTLAANIDASATALGGARGGGVWSTAGGFFPIGTGQMGAFTGSFDGLGHTISNLTMAWPAELAYVGLFGNAQPGSIIKNVGLIAASVTAIGVNGFNQPANGTGALVGTNQGSISNSYATGTVSGSSYVGGLVGNNYGALSNASISNSYAAVAVSGSSRVGGLAGGNYGSGGSITNSYATGAVVGSSTAGGLVGWNTASIANSYATGTVTGNINVGGLAGNNYGSISNSFWNSDVIGTGIGSNAGSVTGGGGLSTIEMHQMSSFASWSISNSSGNDVWQIYEGSTAPLLSSFLTPLTVTASNASTVFNGVGFNGNGVTYSVTPNGNLLGTLTYGAAQDAVGAESYAITPTGLYSNQQGYSITVVSANLTIAPLALTGTLAAGSSVYGAPLTPGAVTFSNLISGYAGVT
jgi:filamentous hemagglutinin family protein